MKKYFWTALSIIVLAVACNQQKAQDDGLLRLSLNPVSPGEKGGLRWSPKGEKLKLVESENGLQAKLFLGPEGSSPVNLLLSASVEGGEFDKLSLDLDRDGFFDGDKDSILSCSPSETRGKIWSSFRGVVPVPFDKSKGQKAVENPYPLSFWYVFDPQEPEAEKVIRYSRRGWMEGKVQTNSGIICILLTESQMDGVFDRNDSWAVTVDSSHSDPLLSKSAKGTNRHNWLGEQAYGIDSLLPSGREIWIKPVDPQITRAEEEAQNDYLAADRAAKRSGGKVEFSHDYKSALSQAKQKNQNLFIDFETTWCGPCKTMDQWVYTADDVISVSSKIVCVKVDGDDNRNLVKKYDITGYPTLVLVSPEGEVLKKVSGYQSVAKTVGFLK